uniref:Protein SIEVE ELEMENT OCCLUSION B n=2 Tax=Quercus lobata TaxID=97700 RepID=A0A7N2L7I1_QUELO
MASYMALVSSGQPNADSLSLLPTLSAEILTQILTTHAPSDIEKLDVESLFSIVNDVLNRATMTVDTVLQLQPGTGPHEATEHLEDKSQSFIPPLCAFKQISCEMQCKGPREKIAGETTLSILKKLSSYSWDAKAVLTLATLALDYGEFCLLAKTQSSDQLAKSMGTLKGVPVLFERLKKHSQAVDDLKKVIKATVEVIKCIIDLTKLSNYAKKDVAVAVYWAIETIVASTTQLCYLITDEEKKQELRPYADNLSVILTNLKKEKAQKKEEEDYRKLKEIVNTPKDLVEVLEIILIDPTNKMPPLIDGSTEKPVEINSLKGKSVFLFISGLHISSDDISILEPFIDKTQKEEQYRIIWIPFVKQWTEDLKKKFKTLGSSKMLYVAMDYSLPISTNRYINQKWNFKFNEPLIVAFNQQGKVECKNAIHMIRVCRVEAFPFTRAREETLLMEKGLIGVTATHVVSQIENWIKEKKYIFLYGGQDNEWIQNFTRSAKVLVDDPMIKEKGISIESVPIQDDNILKRFWNRIKNLFTSRAQRETKMDSVKLHIEKLISYKKKKKEWAVLSQGSSIIVISGKTMLKVLVEFGSWKQSLKEKDFQSAFIEYHNKVLVPDDQICHHMKIPYNTAKIPETMECSHCHRIMDTYISFKCCHKDGA